MICANSQIDSHIELIYSPGFNCYYFKNNRSKFVSLQDYDTPGQALDDFKTDRVIWAQDTQK